MSRLARWLQYEPVRVYVYGIVLSFMAILIAYGIVDNERAALILAAVSAIIAVPAVEKARSKVTPVAGLNEEVHPDGNGNARGQAVD